MSRFFCKKYIYGIFAIGLISICFFIPSTKIHAQESVIVAGGPGTEFEFLMLGEAISLNTKEFTLDGLALMVARIAIDVMTESIVNWINSGFDGNPTFVDNLGGYLTDVADASAGAFIQELGLGFICSPFQLDVQIAVTLDYYAPYRDRARCTLTDVTDNIEGFLGGNFKDGGWRAWYALTANPNNNPYGAYIAAQRELAIRVRNAQGEQLNLLNFGNGFISIQECDGVGADSSSTDLANSGPLGGFGTAAQAQQAGGVAVGTQARTCRITTPGAVIERELGNVLGTNIRQLELADEINEVVGALVGQLLTQVLGPNGLTGVSRSSASSPSYFEKVKTAQANELETQRSQTIEAITDSIALENSYIGTKQSSLSSIATAKNKMAEVFACFDEKANTLSGSNQTEARNRAEHASSTIAIFMDPRTEVLENDISDATFTRNLLTDIKTDVAQAKTATKLSDLIGEYLDLTRRDPGETGALHDQGDIFTAQRERDDLEAEMASFVREANSELAACQVFPEEVSSNAGTNR